MKIYKCDFDSLGVIYLLAKSFVYMLFYHFYDIWCIKTVWDKQKQQQRHMLLMHRIYLLQGWKTERRPEVPCDFDE